MISPEVRSVSTQVESVMNDFVVQCIVKQFDYTNKDEALYQQNWVPSKSGPIWRRKLFGGS